MDNKEIIKKEADFLSKNEYFPIQPFYLPEKSEFKGFIKRNDLAKLKMEKSSEKIYKFIN